MRLLIILLMTCSLHEVAESFHQGYWPWTANGFETVKENNQHDIQCLPEGSNGKDYRGTISVASTGQTCRRWDRTQHIRKDDVSNGLGSHNYCRNPNDKKRPWCWIRSRHTGRNSRRYCDIPQCESNATDQDTEMTCGERTQERKFKIIGGSRASIESQPWLVSIFQGRTFICGGTLIAPCWVLSASHCFPRRAKKEDYTVYLGKEKTSENNDEKEQKLKVARLVLHPDYHHREDDYNNDIALLQIQDSNGQCAKKTPSVRTACLPPEQQMIPYGSFCDITGYGYERNDNIPGYRYSNYMKEAQVQILSASVCSREDYYGKRITENQFCAASPRWTEDACRGDSGGPLLCEVNGRMFLFGVISWGEECAKELKPGVYTKVTNYNTWIAKETGLPMFTKGVMYPQKD